MRDLYIFIKLEMDSLLFTFSKQQLSQQKPVPKNNQDKLTEFLLSYQEKRDAKLKAFRSKKLRRYEQYMDEMPLQDCSFPEKNEEKRFDSICLEEDDLVYKPQSSKQIEIGRRPKVSRNNRQFPPDFNSRYTGKPQSMQLIREEMGKDQQNKHVKTIRQQVQTVIKKRLSTSKDTPKIHFPLSDKKLPQVFRFRSISHEKVKPSSERKTSLRAATLEYSPEKMSTEMRKSRRQVYMYSAQAQNVWRTDSKTEGVTKARRRIVSFCLNAQETPHFKQTIE